MFYFHNYSLGNSVFPCTIAFHSTLCAFCDWVFGSLFYQFFTLSKEEKQSPVGMCHVVGVIGEVKCCFHYYIITKGKNSINILEIYLNGKWEYCFDTELKMRVSLPIIICTEHCSINRLDCCWIRNIYRPKSKWNLKRGHLNSILCSFIWKKFRAKSF